MTEFTITFIIALISLIVIFFLLVCLFISKSIAIEITSENEELRFEIDKLRKDNYSLKYEVKFQKTISKTFSDGLEALTKNKK